MKINKLTPNQNLLWESSRMMLPEHKEALISHDRKFFEKTRPNLDEQKMEEISTIIRDSYYNNVVIKVKVFDKYEDKIFIGVVTQLDQAFSFLKLKQGQEWLKINCNLITDISYGTQLED